MLLLSILSFIILAVSFILFIIPFFFVLPRILLASYFVVDKKLNAIDALKQSWEVTKGNATKVWGIIGLMILMALLCITIIGIPVAIYLLIMYSAAYAVLYEYLKSKTPQNVEMPAPTPSVPTQPAA